MGLAIQRNGRSDRPQRHHDRPVAAIGITNQRETTIVDRETGKPIARAIAWQDRRTARVLRITPKLPDMALRYNRNGLIIDAYFSATKFQMDTDNVAGAREKASRGKPAFGTVDSWLILETLRWQAAHYRRIERITHDAAQYTHLRMG